MLSRVGFKEKWQFRYLLPVIFSFFLCVSRVCGQEVEIVDLDKIPEFPGCESAGSPEDCFTQKMNEHIATHFRYPKRAQKEKIQGKVKIMFTIDNNGDIINIVTKGPHPSLEEEAKRIILKLPKMKPGIYKGKPVNVPFAIPLVFRL